MTLRLTVCCDDPSQEKLWSDQLNLQLSGYAEFQIQVEEASESKEYGQAVFVDVATLQKIDRQGRAVFLVVPEGGSVPDLWKQGKVDDVVVFPFRALEVISKLRCYGQLLMWNEVMELNHSISGVLERLREDLELTERLQKVKLPKRFPKVKGFKVASRYFVGEKPGGDYFDLAETQDQSYLSLVMTHSNSYGLSGAVMTALMRVVMKLTIDHLSADGAVADLIQKIHHELALTLGEKDQLSIFYGAINRRDQVLRFINLGTALHFYAGPGELFERLPQQGAAISNGPVSIGTEGSIPLDPDGRLVLLSFGFFQALGGEQRALELLNQFRPQEANRVLNELAYQIKSTLKDKEELPPQDCTALILDVNSSIIPLAKPRRVEN